VKHWPAVLVVFALVVASMLAPVVIEFSTVEAAKLPWSAFSELAPDVTDVQPAMCKGGAINIARLSNAGVDYVLAVALETKLVVFVVFDKDDAPVSIGMGRIDSRAPDTIPPLVWEPFDPVKHPGPCSDLFPVDA
jgi:hypothetical protein